MFDFPKLVSAVGTFLAAILFFLFGATGCGVMDTGPMMVRETLKHVGPTISTMVSKTNFDQIAASAGAKLANPELKMTGFAGTGVRWEASVQIVGADADVHVGGSGKGQAVDPAVVAIFEGKEVSPGDMEKLIELAKDLKDAKKEETAEIKPTEPTL